MSHALWPPCLPHHHRREHIVYREPTRRAYNRACDPRDATLRAGMSSAGGPSSERTAAGSGGGETDEWRHAHGSAAAAAARYSAGSPTTDDSDAEEYGREAPSRWSAGAGGAGGAAVAARHMEVYSPERRSAEGLHRRRDGGGAKIVYAWGRGEDGQLGLGDTSDQYKPVVVDILKDKSVVQIACGSGHTVVLTDEGQVFTWGRGDDGRLGHGDNGWKYVPRVVEALLPYRVSQVTCGSYHTAAVTDTGALYTWGGGMYGKLGHGNENGHSRPCVVDVLSGVHITEVACGSRHTVALTDKGEVFSWGDSDNGVCGHGEGDGHQYLPRLVAGLRGDAAKQVAACGFHTAVLTTTGHVWSWGEGKFGRLGHGDEENQVEPKRVDALAGTRIRQIACGGFHTACVGEDGRLWTFGGGEHGQLGHSDKINKMEPTLVATLVEESVVMITCGWSHTVALTHGGTVWTWGNGDHGKLGFGETLKVTVPKIVDSLAHVHVTCIASYNEHTAALAEPGTEDELRTISNSFASDLRSLINNSEFSDVTFVLEGKPIYAHRALLAARSEHFRAMFSSGMKESRDGDVSLPGVQYSTFLALLEYVYTDHAEVEPVDAIGLFVLADRFMMERLKTVCEERVQKGISVENAAELLAASDAHGHASHMRSICLHFIVSHFDAVTKSAAFGDLSRELILEILQSR